MYNVRFDLFRGLSDLKRGGFVLVNCDMILKIVF